jgi:crotonobetainyl-CoA:carnitine CoA-transferase CaiB-like acyl-CoA transferase
VTGLLSGVRVVETGVLMAVDNLGRLLGDEGADVVKIEQPGVGDYLRNIMARFAPDWSTFHLTLNRNKRSLTVDARTDEGREIVAALLADADVFITGNIGTTNETLGLDYESVRAVKPDIVYCQVTGFGATGPYAAVPTHGQMMDYLGGAAPSMTVDEGGFVVTTSPPSSEGTGGVVTGPLHAAFGVAAALVRAARTGAGCYLDVSCADAVLAAGWLHAARVLNPEKVDPAGPGGSAGGGQGGSAKYQSYETKDGKFLLFCAIEPKFWDHFCDAVGRDDLRAEHRRDLVVDFGGGDDELRLELQRIFHTRTLAEWMEVAVTHDVTMGPALQFDEVGDDPHLAARGMVVTDDHPVVGSFRTVGNPLLVPGEEFVVRPAPSLGEHTDEVLSELGYDDERRADLRTRGVI